MQTSNSGLSSIRRTVSMNGTAVEALRAHQERQQFYARSIGDLHDHNMVFAGSFGSPLDSHTAWDRFEKALRKADRSYPPTRPMAHHRDPHAHRGCSP